MEETSAGKITKGGTLQTTNILSFRERCMDLVSFDDPIEFKMFEEVMVAGTH